MGGRQFSAKEGVYLKAEEEEEDKIEEPVRKKSKTF